MTCATEPDSSLWVAGVFMSIAASVMTNLGVNLQKYSFIQEAKKCFTDKRPYIKQPLWAFGLSLVVVGSFGDFAALGFAPQTLITPVGGFTMVANVGFAHFFLKETFKRRDAVATFLIILGVILVAAFADKKSQCYTVDELVTLYGQIAFIIYLIFIIFICAAIYLWVRKIETLFHQMGHSSMGYKKVAKYHPVLYPALSGIFGAQSVLLAKSTAELFKVTFAGDNQFIYFNTYVIAIGMFICIFLQIHWLAKGLQYFDAVYIIPLFQCFYIGTSIIGGGVYFDEFNQMSSRMIIMFFVGVFVTLLGVVILSQRDMTRLSGKCRFRAGAKAIIFIKRVQKRLKLNFSWIYSGPDYAELPPATLNMFDGVSTSAIIVPDPSGSLILDDEQKLKMYDMNKRLLSPANNNDVIINYDSV